MDEPQKAFGAPGANGLNLYCDPHAGRDQARPQRLRERVLVGPQVSHQDRPESLQEKERFCGVRGPGAALLRQFEQSNRSLKSLPLATAGFQRAIVQDLGAGKLVNEILLELQERHEAEVL